MKIFFKVRHIKCMLIPGTGRKIERKCDISSLKTLYQFNRLPFGVASAPTIFQYFDGEILHHFLEIFVYLDIFSSQSQHSNDSRVDLQLNEEKCAFLHEQIKYLGHMIDAQGPHSTYGKIKAIKNAP